MKVQKRPPFEIYHFDFNAAISAQLYWAIRYL